VTAKLTVALCDDHAMLRAGLRRLLGDEADLTVIGESGTAEEAVAMARLDKPDVFVLDVGLPGKNGIEAIRQIREVSPSTRILVLTMHDDVAYLREAFAAGASGYLVKRAADVELVLAVRAVAAGERYVHPSLGAALLEGTSILPGSSAGSQDQLSQREIEILRLLAVGHTNAEIARSLHLSVRTIETHRAHVQQKLGLRSRADLARYARERGLLG
jgi:DNA-binding NarL/FixJ family response regulator